MPRALILFEPPAAPEPLRMGLLGLGYNVVDELDEPFGALDALTRANLQDELMRIVTTTGSTVLMVTHDVDEAVLLSDRSVMMTNGPAATIGEILAVPLARPRERLALAHDAQ